MPVYDTPITTDDNNLKKVLSQNLPVVVYLYDSRNGTDKPLEDAIKKIAKKESGQLLVARVDVANNPRIRQDYDSLQTPAIVTSVKGFLGRKVKSQVGGIRPADVRAHIDYLLDRGPEPTAAAASEPASANVNGGKEKVQHVSDATFRNVVLKSGVPVLVDFWAPWCGPCRAIAPVIEEMARSYSGRARVVKLNVDENPRIAHQFQVQSIPTLIMFKGGQPIERRVGANRNIIRDMIEESLLS